MKVYDCLMFMNEAELLEIRLNELQDVVDKFIIVQAEETHTGNKKPVVTFFGDKICNYFLPKLEGKDAWEKEWYQRNKLLEGAKAFGAEPDDVIMISDVDEIPRAATLLYYLGTHDLFSDPFMLEQELYYYNVNTYMGKWCGTTIATVETIEKFGGPQACRDRNGHGNSKIADGGWHFSYFGGVERMRLKVRSFSHAHDDWTERFLAKDDRQITEDILARRDLIGRDMNIEHRPTNDKRLPKYFLDNISKFRILTEEHYALSVANGNR
jgi:beta-1,4-mannosyl-glycoprotein beta-1,4-N-acetylglucosaminyltransferase